MRRKWVLALAAMGVTTAVIFPLELLWIGSPPLKALVPSLLAGVVSLVGVLCYKRAEPASDAPDYPMPLLLRIMLVILLVLSYGGFFLYEAYNESLARAVIQTVMIAMAVLTTFVARKCCQE